MPDAKIPILVDGRPIRKPISGVAQYVCNLTDHLARNRCIDLRLFTLEFRRSRPDTEFEFPNAALRHVSSIPRKVFNIAAEHLDVPVADYLADDVQIIHHTFFGWLPSRRNARVVSTIHDVIPIEQPSRFTRTNAFYSRKNFWRQVNESDSLIAVSEFTKRRVLAIANIPSERVRVIPNGVRDLASLATEECFAKLQREHGITRPFILYVGNIEPRKGVSTLLKAFKVLGSRDVQLVIAGRKCWGYEKIESEMNAFPPGTLVSLGYVSEVEKAALLKNAAAFVYPSTYEGFGIPVVEAMQCGCPVISADNSSLTEVAEGAALMFETENAEHLVQQIHRLLGTEELRSSLVGAGRRRALQYTWERAAHATVEVYKALV